MSVFGARAASAEPPALDVTVASVQGEVHVTSQARQLDVHKGDVVPLPATIYTGPSGSIELRQGNTTVSAAPNSQLEIPPPAIPGEAIDRVIQSRGNAFYNVAKRGASKLHVESAYLVAVIKGTQFSVVAQDDSATISLFEGRLEVRATDGSDVIDLHAGEIAIRHANDSVIRMLRMDSGEPLAHRAPPASPVSLASAGVTAGSSSNSTTVDGEAADLRGSSADSGTVSAGVGTSGVNNWGSASLGSGPGSVSGGIAAGLGSTSTSVSDVDAANLGNKSVNGTANPGNGHGGTSGGNGQGAGNNGNGQSGSNNGNGQGGGNNGNGQGAGNNGNGQNASSNGNGQGGGNNGNGQGAGNNGNGQNASSNGNGQGAGNNGNGQGNASNNGNGPGGGNNGNGQNASSNGNGQSGGNNGNGQSTSNNGNGQNASGNSNSNNQNNSNNGNGQGGPNNGKGHLGSNKAASGRSLNLANGPDGLAASGTLNRGITSPLTQTTGTNLGTGAPAGGAANSNPIGGLLGGVMRHKGSPVQP